MNQLIAQAAQQYRPADRDKFVQYVRSTPMAAAQLRAPLFEDKVVDFLFSKANVSDRTVSREELEKAIESDEGFHVHGPGCGHDHDHDHGEAKPRKAATKKAKAEPGPAADEKPAKKPAVKKTAAAKPETGADKPAKKPAAKKAPAKKG
jgi:trigger factor